MKCILRLTVILLFVSLPTLGTFGQKISTEEEIKTDLGQVSCKSADRLESVIALFKRAGASEEDIAVVEKDGTKNVVITKKGLPNEILVVGAHYDKTDDGCGAIDNWTGIVTMAHLYATLKNFPTTKTLKFVAFDKEEKGLLGSEAFVKQIPKEERSSYCAMVNLDSFGFATPQTFQQATSETLRKAAESLWTEMKVTLGTASIPGAEADSMSFIKAGIPAITFSGLNTHWADFLHTSKDQIKNVNTTNVWMAYRTILPFVDAVDKQPCGAYRKK